MRQVGLLERKAGVVMEAILEEEIQGQLVWRETSVEEMSGNKEWRAVRGQN